jgi:hypothetical protein
MPLPALLPPSPVMIFEKQGIYAYELALKGSSPIYEMNCMIDHKY